MWMLHVENIQIKEVQTKFFQMNASKVPKMEMNTKPCVRVPVYVCVYAGNSQNKGNS